MIFLHFKKDDNNFEELIRNSNIKKFIRTKLYWSNNLLLGISSDIPKELISYLNIKYGDLIFNINQLSKDRTPVPGIDYYPKKNKN